MEFAIRHFVAGRVRLYVPTLCRRRPLAEASLAWLRAQTGVKRARINYDCSSLVVEYDVAREPLLRAIVGRLALMDLDDLRALVMPANKQDCAASFPVGAVHRPEAERMLIEQRGQSALGERSRFGSLQHAVFDAPKPGTGERHDAHADVSQHRAGALLDQPWQAQIKVVPRAFRRCGGWCGCGSRVLGQ